MIKITRHEPSRYERGMDRPNYPVPAIVAPMKYNNDYDNRWRRVYDAAQWFNSIGASGGINWDWEYFLSENDAIGFDTWCKRNCFDTRGVYSAGIRSPIGVRWR